jgi:hypothetical protein
MVIIDRGQANAIRSSLRATYLSDRNTGLLHPDLMIASADGNNRPLKVIKESRFSQLAESILCEAKIDDAIAKAKLGPDDSSVLKREFAAAGSKAGFIDFLLKDGNYGKEGVGKTLKEFDNRKASLEKKDINAYSTLDELKTAIGALGLSRGQKSAQADKDAPVIFENDKYVVRQILTPEAAIKYGAGSGWEVDESGKEKKLRSRGASRIRRTGGETSGTIPPETSIPTHAG